MALKGTLENRVAYRIKRNASAAFVRQDFADLGGYDQIGRVLRTLVRKGLLVSLGYGVYARAKTSSVSGQTIPEKPLSDLAKEAMRKLGAQTKPSRAERRYNKGQSTQIPTGRVIGVNRRISRKLGFNGTYISFEKSA